MKQVCSANVSTSCSHLFSTKGVNYALLSRDTLLASCLLISLSLLLKFLNLPVLKNYYLASFLIGMIFVAIFHLSSSSFVRKYYLHHGIQRPSTQKIISIGSLNGDENIVFCSGEMQGWRVTMEDAYIACASLFAEEEFEPPWITQKQNSISVFSVLDGHGGDSVSKLSSVILPYIISKLISMSCRKPTWSVDNIDLGATLRTSFMLLDRIIFDIGSIPSTTIDVRGSVFSLFNSNLIGRYSEQLYKAYEGLEESSDYYENTILLEHFLNSNHTDFCQSISENIKSDSNGIINKVTKIVLENRADAKTNQLFTHMGSTCVTVLMRQNEFVIANCGDSRAVLCRNAQGIALTKDHKPQNILEKKRIENAGGQVTQVGHCYRINHGLNLSRAIGDFIYKMRCSFPIEEQMVISIPDIVQEDRTENDEFIILGCDGVWDTLSNQKACDVIREKLIKYTKKFSLSKALRQTMTETLDMCCAQDPQISDTLGLDNITLQIILLKDPKTYISVSE